MPPRKKPNNITNLVKPKAPPSYNDKLKATKLRLQKEAAVRQTVGKKICLTMIVKNESKIITRLLDSLIPIIDMISIVDTGSTDNTKEIISKWGEEHQIPTKVHFEPFQNFGYNRSHSVKIARETFPGADYFLLSDADFIWEINPDIFDKRLLFEDKYSVTQYSDTNEYPNIRLLNNILKWHCVGVTHEYWDAIPGQRDSTEGYIKGLRIKDIEDGGAKADKYERDYRLFTEAFKTEKDPFLIGRYKFYFAQTLKCMQRYREAIVAYQDKIDYQGSRNYQEIFHSYYSIGDCQRNIYYNLESCIKYMKKKEIYEQEQKKIELGETIENPKEKLQNWQQKIIDTYNPSNSLSINELEDLMELQIPIIDKAYKDAHENRPFRIEPIYRLIEFYRKISKRQEAYDLIIKYRDNIKKPEKDLFVEYPCYDYLFDWEMSIVGCYINKEEGRKSQLKLIDRLDDLPVRLADVVKSNAKYYV